MTTCEQILNKFPDLCASHQGDLKKAFKNISSLEHIHADSMVYILNEKYLATANESAASVVLAPLKLKDKIPATSKMTWILSPNPELLMAFVKREFILKTPYRAESNGPHPTAVIDPSAQIGKNTSIGPYAVIHARVKIADSCFIGAHAVIEADAEIGENSTIHSFAYIGHHCVVGKNCEVQPHATIGSEGYGYAHDAKGNHYRIPHSGRVILKDDVHVGANTAIDRGSIDDSIIGEGTKIDNQCHLAHNSVIGKNCLITAQFGMAGSSQIGDRFICGGKTSVTGHIEITNDVNIAGMSGVTKSIDKPGAYGGFPLQPLQEYLKTKAAMVHLHELRQQIKTYFKKENS